jgi:hypothetical protein
MNLAALLLTFRKNSSSYSLSGSMEYQKSGEDEDLWRRISGPGEIPDQPTKIIFRNCDKF